MEVATAFVKFLGDLSPIDKDVQSIPARTEPHAKTAGNMFATHIGNGIKVGIGALASAGVAGAMLKLSEPLERSEATMKASFASIGKNVDDYKGSIEEAIKTQARYGHGQADVEAAIAKLTMAFKDPKRAIESLSDAQQIAAKSHISLDAAADALVKGNVGKAGKMMAGLGINIKDATTLLSEQTKAVKAHDVAAAGLEKATKALSDLEARDAGVKKLSVAQQQQLAAAHKAVADAQAHSTGTAAQLEKANAAVNGVTKDQTKLIHEWALKTHLAEAQAETFSGRMEGAKTTVENFAGSLGAKAAPALTALGPAAMLAGGLVESGALRMIGSGIKVAASWVADTAKFLVQQGIRLAAWVAANAVMVATAVATGIAAAAAFMLPLLPFILIGLAVAGLVVLIVTHFDQIKAVITGAVGFVINWVKANWPLLLTILLGPFGFLLAFVIQHFDQIKSAASSLIEDIAGFFSKLPGRVLDFFTGLPGKLMQVGKDMIHAIAQGLASAAGSVPVIGGALKSFLQSFEMGGIVAGQGPQLVIAHGGERVLTAAQQAGGHGGQAAQTVNHNYNFNAPIDPNAGRFLGREIAWEMKTSG